MPVLANERPIGKRKLKDDSNNQRFEVEMNGAIRWLLIQIRITMDTSATAPTLLKDDILRWVTQVQLVLNGKPLKIDSDGLTQFIKETILKGQEPYKKTNALGKADQKGKIVGWDMVFDFARFVLRDDDISSLLQTRNLSDLEVVFSTGKFADIASANKPTFSKATVEFFLRDYSGTIDGKDLNDDTQVSMTNVVESRESVKLESGQLQFDANCQEIPLKSGANILDHILIVKDDGVRANNLVTDLKFANSKGQRLAFLERSFESVKNKNKIDYDLNSALDGVNYIDWTEKLGVKSGLKTGARSNQLLKLLTSNDLEPAKDRIDIYTRYL